MTERQPTDLEIEVAAFLSTDEDLAHLESPMFLKVAERMAGKFAIARLPGTPSMECLECTYLYCDEEDIYFASEDHARKHFAKDERGIPELEKCEFEPVDRFVDDKYLTGFYEDLVDKLQEEVPELSDEDYAFEDRLSLNAEAEFKKFFTHWLLQNFNKGQGIISPNGVKVNLEA